MARLIALRTLACFTDSRRHIPVNSTVCPLAVCPSILLAIALIRLLLLLLLIRRTIRPCLPIHTAAAASATTAAAAVGASARIVARLSAGMTRGSAFGLWTVARHVIGRTAVVTGTAAAATTAASSSAVERATTDLEIQTHTRTEKMSDKHILNGCVNAPHRRVHTAAAVAVAALRSRDGTPHPSAAATATTTAICSTSSSVWLRWLAWRIARSCRWWLHGGLAYPRPRPGYSIGAAPG